MPTRLTLLCCGATIMARAGGFAAPDEPLDAAGQRQAARVRLTGPAPTSLLTSRASAARQTAAAIGVNATAVEALDDMDWGEWTGRSFAEVHDGSPDAFAAWLSDPAGGAPRGERIAALTRRVERWFSTISPAGGRIVAITHPMVVRAILTLATGMAPAAAMRIDLAPLSTTELSFNRGWRLQELRRP